MKRNNDLPEKHNHLPFQAFQEESKNYLPSHHLDSALIPNDSIDNDSTKTVSTGSINFKCDVIII